jgi:DNA-binding CsgD family transcriptional regulator
MAKTNSILEKKLTPTERSVLELIAEGYSSTQIAKFRNCSPQTIEKHRSHNIQKLELPTSQNALLIYTLKKSNDL